MKKLIILFILIILLSGCTTENELDKMSEAIIKYHYDYNYKVDNLSSKNQKILEQFKTDQREENKVINLSELGIVAEDNMTDEPNTQGVYYENGAYFIKYKDLTYEKPNKTDEVAFVNVDGYEVDVCKSDFPILYYETRDIKYQYRFMKKVTEKQLVKYYYRSYGDGRILTINYKMNNNEIEDIRLIYNDAYLSDEESSGTNSGSNFGHIVFIAIITFLMVFAIYKSIKLYIGFKN